MERRLRDLAIEVTGAESPKFTAPLLLVHGLWCTAVVWRRWSGFLAHRGWTCHALNLRGRMGAAAATSLADYDDDVRRVIAGFETPPVIVGHDLGALLALRAADAARAVVAVAPRVPRPYWPSPSVDLRRVGVRFSLWRGGPVAPPRGALGHAYFGDPRLPRVAEPAAVVGMLAREDFAIAPSPTPTLIVGAQRDAVVPAAATESLAQHLGVTLRTETGAGHALLIEAGWERHAGEVHRWIIRTLGDPLLALREEEETLELSPPTDPD